MELNEDTARRILKSPLSVVEGGKETTPPPSDGLWLVALDSEVANYRNYSGKCALFMLDGVQTLKVTRDYPFSSHPGQIRTEASGTPDVDKDGLKDVAWAIPRYTYSYHGKRSSSDRFNPTTKTQPVLRNLQGHETFKEVRAFNSKIYQATDIQVHAGSSRKPVSIGCFTLPPDDYKALAERIESLKVSSFRLVFAHTETL